MRLVRHPATSALFALWAIAIGATARALGAPCPPGLASLTITLAPPSGGNAAEVLIGGSLSEGSCDAGTAGFDSYDRRIFCDPSVPETCSTTVDDLRPGVWTHRVFVVDGDSSGQLQGRRGLLLDRSAGTQTLVWPLFRSVATVTSLSDQLDCTGCLRDALMRAQTAPKPHLLQFAEALTGAIELVDRLPEVTSDDITIDARTPTGLAYERTIDAKGLGHAALRVTGSRNHIIGLRVVGVGGDSDAVLVEGAGANANHLESLQVVGRAIAPCQVNGNRGCIINGICRAQNQSVNGFCGDDAIAVRDDAGALAVNVIEDCDVSGAFDKGIKSSEGGVVVVRASWIHDNSDGGMQATLGGQLEAYENVSENNQGSGANGIAANGARLDGSDPARLVTRGNLVRGNGLRGISVRSLSNAVLQDDYVCGNGTTQSGGFALTLLEAAGAAPQVEVRGMAGVHNSSGGALLLATTGSDFGTVSSPGNNAFAFNGSDASATPVNLRNPSTAALPAVGNYWQSCGRSTHCDEAEVRAHDVFASGAPVEISPAAASVQRRTPRIRAISPPLAAAGDLVRIYGSGFDAITGNEGVDDCASIAAANPCPPRRGNCVLVGDQPAEVVAVTPTLLVIRAPFTCVAPVTVAVRTRWARGFARASFCAPADPVAP